MKAERLKELEKTYEAISLKLGPKGKSDLRKCSVPDKKLTALDEWHQGHHTPRKWRLSKDKSHIILE